MSAHFIGYVKDCPALRPQSIAQLGLLPGDKPLIESTRSLERINAH
jgi:hypothetical protein